MTQVTTSYRGFAILVSNDGFIVLGRDGRPVYTKTKITSMATARALVAELRRKEREAA